MPTLVYSNLNANNDADDDDIAATMEIIILQLFSLKNRQAKNDVKFSLNSMLFLEKKIYQPEIIQPYFTPI